MPYVQFAENLIVAITIPTTPGPMPWAWGQTSTIVGTELNDRFKAVATRREWMELMHYSPDEIADACSEPMINLQEEKEQLLYAQKLKVVTPRHAVLESWSIKQ